MLLVSIALATPLTPADDWCGALAEAAEGEAFELAAGDYAGPCSIRTSVQVTGSGARIVYNGTTSNVIDVYADGVTLEGLAFGPTNADIDAIKVRGGTGVTVRACTFTHIGGIGISANSADTAGLRILDNTFTDLDATGVYLGCHDGSCAATDYTFTGNTIDGVTSSGVGYAIEAKLNSWGTIAGNELRDAQGPAITVYGSERGDTTRVEANVVASSRSAATLEIAGGPAVVRNNVVIGGAAGGLYVYDYGGRGLVSDITVVGNTLWGAGGAGATLSGWAGGANLTFADNAVGRADGAAALPAPVDGATFEGNVDCGDGAACWPDAAGLALGPLDGGALLGAGAARADLPDDYCGRRRADPPTAGALEPGAAHPVFASGVDADARCSAGPVDTGSRDTGDTAGDAATPHDTAGPDAAGDGCGCAVPGGADGAAGALLALLAGVAVARRRPGR